MAPDLDVGSGEQRYDTIRNAGLEQTRVGHDQHPRATKSGDFLRQRVDRAATLNQAIDIVENETLLHTHLPLLDSKVDSSISGDICR